MFQEVLVVRENHVVQRNILTHEDTSIITNLFKSDGVAIERHLMATGIVVEPKMIETITHSLSFVSGVADVEHDCWFLTEEGVFIETNRVMYMLIGYKNER